MFVFHVSPAPCDRIYSPLELALARVELATLVVVVVVSSIIFNISSHQFHYHRSPPLRFFWAFTQSLTHLERVGEGAPFFFLARQCSLDGCLVFFVIQVKKVAHEC